MSERTLAGFAASPGQAAGPAVVLAGGEHAAAEVPAAARQAELAQARRAFEAAAADVVRIAERLRTEGRLPEAEIVETGALMAADPTLDREVSRLVLVEGRPAADAIQVAAEGAAGAAGLAAAGCWWRTDWVRPTWPTWVPTSAASHWPAEASPPTPPSSPARSACPWWSASATRCSTSRTASPWSWTATAAGSCATPRPSEPQPPSTTPSVARARAREPEPRATCRRGPATAASSACS
ncbi:MAG: hypothetical protein E6I08_13505 [Chloroflexi bacterium]|nr:MAG: hypothetical protein E6I08_13505 [Chloroflexota bacterium]